MNKGLYDGLGRPIDGAMSDGQGDLRIAGYALEANSCILQLYHKGRVVFHGNSDPAATYTLPAENRVNFARFTAIMFINEGGGNNVTIAVEGSDILQLAGSGATGSRTLGGYGWATAIKIKTGPAAVWLISGTGIS